MEIIIIAACDPNGVIGTDGKLPWRIKEDMDFFRTVTDGYAVIMGRLTNESIPGRILKNRCNIVVSKNRREELSKICTVMPNIYKALRYAEYNGYQRAYIIGGEKLFRLGLRVAHRAFITHVRQIVDIDGKKNVTKFPLDQLSKFFYPVTTINRPDFDFCEYRKNK